MKFKFRYDCHFFAWYLLPTIRFGLHESGGFVALTFLKGDACLGWEKADK